MFRFYDKEMANEKLESLGLADEDDKKTLVRSSSHRFLKNWLKKMY